MDFTIHSMKDIESWLKMYRPAGMDIDLHFHLKRSPDIPGRESLLDNKPETNSLIDMGRGEAPPDWVKDKETDQYIWKEEVTSEEKTPEGYDYVGPSENDVWKDYQNSASNGISRLYRKYLGAPDIDRQSFFDARNEDLKKLVKEVFDAVKNRVDRINNKFDPIDLSGRGSGQYYGAQRSFGMKQGTFSNMMLELEYDEIVFTARIGFDPLDPYINGPNSLGYVETAESRAGHSKYNVFEFVSPKRELSQPRLYIQMDRDAFEQVYKEIIGSEYRD